MVITTGAMSRWARGPASGGVFRDRKGWEKRSRWACSPASGVSPLTGRAGRKGAGGRAAWPRGGGLP